MPNFLDKSDRSQHRFVKGGSAPKTQIFKWTCPSAPGELAWISKGELNLDDRYQRDAISQEKVLRIARDWDWMIFGVLLVARRPDGTYWVFDGGHRTRAAFYRADIDVLPCIVFRCDAPDVEARTFVGAATMRTGVDPVDRHRAALVAGEPVATTATAMLQELGIALSRDAKPGTLRCISAIEKAVVKDYGRARACLQIAKSIARDEPVHGDVFRGLFLLVGHFEKRDVLAEFDEQLRALTNAELSRAFREMKAELTVGGEKTFALALMKLLNKGGRRSKRLQW